MKGQDNMDTDFSIRNLMTCLTKSLLTGKCLMTGRYHRHWYVYVHTCVHVQNDQAGRPQTYF